MAEEKFIFFGIPSEERFISSILGKATKLFHIKNNNKLQAVLTNYGARMVGQLVPDKNGNLVDVVVGFDGINRYVAATDQCYGAVVGRYAGRIAQGKFKIDGQAYQLDVNNGNNAIHGGNSGFQTRVWDAEQLSDGAVRFSYVSADGEEGYPGKLSVKVTYTLNDDDELRIDFEYASDKKTIANIINHNFWNLNGEGSGAVHNHLLKINTASFNAINKDCIPISIASVENTPFDFRDFISIGARINDDDEQLRFGTGYDHTYALGTGVSAEPELAAFAIGDVSRIKMEMFTTEPGVHFYTGNFMDGSHRFKCGATDEFRTAFCLEAQHYPNSPNQPSAPSTVKEAGRIYSSSTIHKFSISL